ncbi:MAG TPA: radical SAM protein [Terriglobia bacterium]|nr:radical SAM protein [Terriglobia bacterium]
MERSSEVKAAKVLSAWGKILLGHTPILSIEITRECPLACPGCYAYGESHLGGTTTLRQLHDLRGDALVDGVLALVRKHHPLQVSFIGGEPLIRHRELDRILPTLSQWGVNALVTTSLVLPFPASWNSLPGIRVAVSIDGLQPEHDRRRRPATYERILKNLEGLKVDISWVVTDPMMTRDGYLDEYLAFWTSRAETNRVWMSLYTPQKGEQSDEMLTSESRRRLLAELPALKLKYPDLILPDAAIQAFDHPPEDPAHCAFTRISTNYSADLKTIVEPCFYGGSPDCAQCGCAVSMALHTIHAKRLAPGLTAGQVLDGSLAVGRVVRSVTGAAA